MTNFTHLLILIKARWMAFANYLARPNKDKILRWAMIAVLGILFVWGDYIFFYRIIQYLDGLPFSIGEELIVQLLNVVFLTLFVMTIFSTLIVSLSVFYLSADLEMLLSAPVSMGPVISLRFMQTVINSSWMILLFSIPIYVAYGNFFNVPWSYYFYLFLGLIPFILIPCLLGVSGVMALIRYFPNKKTHQVLSLLGLVFLVGMVVYLRFLSPEKFFGKDVSDEMIILFVEQLRAPDYSFLPSTWITVGLVRFVEGNFAPAFVQLSFLYLAVTALAGLGYWTGRKIYFVGWCSMQEVWNSPPDNNGKREESFFLRRIPLSRVQRSLMIKDMRMFFRDPEQWSQMFILCALVVVYIFNIMNLPLDNLALKNVVSVLNIGLVGFVLSALSSRFVFAAPSMEGREFWAIYTAPVNLEKFIWTKFLLFFPPLLALAEMLVVISNYLLQVDGYVMKVSFIGVFLITGGLVGLGLGLGARYPMFDYDNVSEISTSTGGVLFMILSLSFVGAVMVLVARPMYVHFNERFLFKSIGGIDVPICYALILVLALVVTVIPIRQGVLALKEMDL
ncbi:MAG: hypothetical protein VX667_05510 [Nitrospinota bacterium]|nr:hypothetical protein [Nitrospinota bacterium]